MIFQIWEVTLPTTGNPDRNYNKIKRHVDGISNGSNQLVADIIKAVWTHVWTVIPDWIDRTVCMLDVHEFLKFNLICSIQQYQAITQTMQE